MELKVELTEEALLTFKEHWLLSLKWVIANGLCEMQGEKKKAQGALFVLGGFFLDLLYISIINNRHRSELKFMNV